MDAFAALRREEGQGMTEYAVVLAVVVTLGLGIAVIIQTALGNKITSIFTGW
jgi:Flp pilus assembly pilin Flp